MSLCALEQDWTLDQLGNWFGFNEDSDGNGTNNLVQTRYHNSVNEIDTNNNHADGPGASITATTGTNWADPAYDAAGNATTLPAPLSPTSTLALKYDAWNRLVEVKNSSNVVITTNKYDSLNRRIVRDEPGASGVTRYYYNEDWQVMVEATGTGTPTPTAIYAYHPRYVDAIAHRMRANDSHTYLHDANFNVTAMIEPDSDVAERYSYTPYGEVTFLDENFANPASSSAIGNEILYTGRERDSSTGLQLNRNRFYHASLGRWANQDPIGYDGGTRNLYEYVSNAPVNATDPSGLWEDWGGGPRGDDWYDPRDGIKDGDVPGEVPGDWDADRIDQEISEWEDSVGGREYEQDRRPEGDDAGHRERIRRENEWLEKLRKRRGEITVCVAAGAGAGITWRAIGRGALNCCTIPFRIFVMPYFGDPEDGA
jgi:RHS repeat-associated protein